MANDKRNSWEKFQKLNFNSKKLSKSAQKAEGATVRHARKFIVHRWDNIRSVRRHVIGWLVLVGVLIAAVGLQLNWFQRSYSMEAPIAGGTYAEAAVGPVENLNPLYSETSAERSANNLLFSSLYDYDSAGALRADLATNMQISEDGTVYTITIRDDVRWHDGTKLTADDVVFTVNTIKDPSTRSTIRGWQDIDVAALNDTTVTFTLPATYAPFPHALTSVFIIPEHLLGDVQSSLLRENNFSQEPVGTGPYELQFLQTVDSNNGRKIVHMAANERYYKGAAKIPRFQLHVYGDSDAIATALRTSEVNAATDLSLDSIASIDRNRYTVTAHTINNGVYTLFNTQGEILKDRTVRRALQAATNTNAIRQEISGDVQPLHLPFVNGQLQGEGVPTPPAFSTARAKELLDDAGWQLQDDGSRVKGDDTLELRLTTLKGSEYEKVVEVLARQWREVGIGVQVEVLDPADSRQNVSQRLQQREFDVLVYELSIGADPDVYAYWHSSQDSSRLLNLSGYMNGQSDDALSSARSTLDPVLRNAKYINFAEQWLEDVPAIGIYQSVMYYVHSRNSETVSEDIKLVTPSDRYADVRYWTVNKGTVYKTP